MRKVTKIMLLTILMWLSIGFVGCATDKAYGVAKTVYIGGKAVVIQNADLLPKETLDTLKKADEYAQRYDKARGVIKKSVEPIVDMNLSKSAGTE